MSEIIGNLEKRLITTREKIRSRRRELTGGIVEDKVKEIGKKTYEELDKDLDALQQAVKEGRTKAGESGHKLFDELREDISAARTKLREKRLEITGGAVEEKTRGAAHTIKVKGESALREIEEDIAKITEKLKGKSKEEQMEK